MSVKGRRLKPKFEKRIKTVISYALILLMVFGLTSGMTLKVKAVSSNYYYDFEDGFQGWTVIDADGDGHNWVHFDDFRTVYSYYSGLELTHWMNGEDNPILSGSYFNDIGALSPDNYLVSPKVILGGSISFYAAPMDLSFPNETFGVFVSTDSNTNPDDFYEVASWTLSSSGLSENDKYREFTADLSQYSGEGYVAIRHYNCYDQYIMGISDVTIVPGLPDQEITAPDEITLKVGATYAIDASTDGDGALSYAVTAGDAVTVDADGNITAVSAGNATITVTAAATANYKEATKDISVVISEKDPQVIDANDLSLLVGETASLNASITEGDGTLSYAVTGDAISFDASTGAIEAVSEGSATITITASETDSYAETVKTVTVTVTDDEGDPEEEPEDEDIPPVDWLDPLRTKLHIAGEMGTPQTVEFEGDYALPYEFMLYLQEHPQVTLVYHVIYQGIDTTVTIPGNRVKADPEIFWYGPLWLNYYFGNGTITDCSGVYIVKKGDTLTSIAAQFKTTIQALVNKNGIKNPDLIFVGQEIKY